ncbi:MAG TPA: hypothetical protein GX707_19530 [Epulopiscium sp.]|nr:hypothetical protein [Candidatus Epulonipiscium sp.]
MAINNFLGKIKHTSEKVAGSVAPLSDKVTELMANTADQKSINAINNEIKILVEDKTKMYQFIGMEVYDLYTAGKVELEQLGSFYEKINTIDSDIKKLEHEKSIQESIKNNICSCGFKLKKGQQFCPSCGASTEKLMDEELGEVLLTSEAGQEVECVCGAVVDSSGLMCMECGRRIEH